MESGGGPSTSSSSLLHHLQVLHSRQQIDDNIDDDMEASPEISSSEHNAPSTSSSSVGLLPSSSSSSSTLVAETLAAAVEASINAVANAASEDRGHHSEPCKKKARVDGGGGGSGGGGGVEGGSSNPNSIKNRSEKLEQRLGGILCCAVCLDLPRAAIYQCTNGHLMCAGCFTHLLADARLRDEIATCPNCRVEISKHLASRNLAVEKAVNELPSECQFCNKEFARNSLEHHVKESCEERTSICKYHRIGCPWRGPLHELLLHQENCIHPKKSGAEVMDILTIFDQTLEQDKKLYLNIFELLNYEKITFNDLQLKPYRTDEFVHKLYYETARFSAFNNQWVVKSRINNNQRDPTQSCDRQLTYQLILKTKPTTSLDISFVVLKGPFGDMKINPNINRFEFSEQNNESPYFHLPINDTSEVNRLLSQKTVQFRLIAFLQ